MHRAAESKLERLPLPAGVSGLAAFLRSLPTLEFGLELLEVVQLGVAGGVGAAVVGHAGEVGVVSAVGVVRPC